MTDTQEEAAPSIHVLINRVMSDIRAVEKNSEGDGLNYKFRSIDAVMNALNPALVRHGVFVVPTVLGVEHERLNDGRAHMVMLTVAYDFYGPRGDHVRSVGMGESVDYSDKATNQAMSMAYKYVMLETFCIPTEDMQDGDQKRPAVENADPGSPTVSLAEYINTIEADGTPKLNKFEKRALRDAWKSAYDFPTTAVPLDLEGECRVLIDSYAGTVPDPPSEPTEATAVLDETPESKGQDVYQPFSNHSFEPGED